LSTGVAEGMRADLRPAAGQLPTRWYFAEGYTNTGFDEYLTIQNPGAAGAATITYYIEGRSQPEIRSVPLPANSRTTVAVHQAPSASNPGGLGRLDVGHATVIESTTGIVVERPIYFTFDGAIGGGHIVMGATAPRPAWYFAEGYTAPGFHQFLTILNPNPVPVSVRLTYYRTGAAPLVKAKTIPASTRATVAVHEEAEGVGRNGGHGWEVATLVESTGGDIVVERPIYFVYTPTEGTGGIPGGHNAMGVEAPRPRWYFAEGYTGAGFDQFLTIMNPNPTPVEARLTYYRTGAAPLVKTKTVPAASRATVAVHEEAEGVGRAGGQGWEVATLVESVSGGAIVVERPIYFRYRGHITGGHTVPGAAAPAPAWSFAEGYTGPDFDQYFTVLNPAPRPVPLRLTYYREGAPPVSKTTTVGASTRLTVPVHDEALGAGRNGGQGWAVSALVEATDGAGIVVERPIYFQYQGRTPGGHNVLGLPGGGAGPAPPGPPTPTIAAGSTATPSSTPASTATAGPPVAATATPTVPAPGAGTATATTTPTAATVPTATATRMPTATRTPLAAATATATSRAGSVLAWGNNDQGQLGDGMPLYRTRPHQVMNAAGAGPLANVVMLTAGGGTSYYSQIEASGHSLALTGDGTVWAWGMNEHGQLGNGTIIPSGRPVPVAGVGGTGTLGGITQIAAGQVHNLALRNDGMVVAWGSNVSHQLGELGSASEHCTGTTWAGKCRRRPIVVGGLDGIIAIATGHDHSLALKGDGTVWAWGNGFEGQLGDGATRLRETPMMVKGLAGVGTLSGIVAITAGGNHNLALRGDGTVWAWGENGNGRLGDGTQERRLTPVQVKGAGGVGALTGVTAIVAGESHSLALTGDGTIWAWGGNVAGQVGDGSTESRAWPVPVRGLGGIRRIAAGGSHSLALGGDGTAWAWGANWHGQLGDGTITGRPIPVAVGGLSDVSRLEAGDAHSLALRGDGTVWSWGLNDYGQLGDGRSRQRAESAPVALAAGVAAIQADFHHALALRLDGTVQSWGANYRDQLGRETRQITSQPETVGGLAGVVAVDPGDHHSLALTGDGTVWAWGWNRYGQLGDGTTSGGDCACRITPTRVVGLTDVVAIGGGTYHSLALKRDGTVWAWGRNVAGQLGDGSTTDRPTPVRVMLTDALPLTGVVAIAAGEGHNLALIGDGTVWAWGWNDYGQTGDNASNVHRIRNWPVQVTGAGGAGVLTGITTIAAGERHSLALRDDGTVWTWGWSRYGQLGDGTTGNHACHTYDRCRGAPVRVTGLGNVRAVAGGGKHSLAVTTDGRVWAWGANDMGQLGLPEEADRLAPAPMPGVAGATFVTAGYDSSFAQIDP
jgi:alpha-tubulin suppressor-like RCC1 family protein